MRTTVVRQIHDSIDVNIEVNELLGVYQQTTSGLSTTNQDCYELEKGCFAVYGFEYKPG